MNTGAPSRSVALAPRCSDWNALSFAGSSLAIQRAAAHLPKCELAVFATARHELFSETDSIRGRWFGAMETFLQPILDRTRARAPKPSRLPVPAR